MIKIIKSNPSTTPWLTRTNHLQLRDLIADECISFEIKEKTYLKVPGMFLSYTCEDVIDLATMKKIRLSCDSEIIITYNQFNQTYLSAKKVQKLMIEINEIFAQEQVA